MLCQNTQAEINHDTQTNAQEHAQFRAEEAAWIRFTNAFLAGQSIDGLCLADRMADQYEEFSDFVNQDYDFMKAYKEGKFCASVNELFRHEAKALASIVVGDI